MKQYLKSPRRCGIAIFSAIAFLTTSLIGAPQSYTQWASANNLADGAEAPEANPAGDGINNLVKYALGLDPNVASRDGAPTSSIVDGKVTLSITKNSDAVGIDYIVEASSDLVNWSTDGLTVVEDTDTSLVVAESGNGSDRLFLRLRIPVPEIDDGPRPDAFVYVAGGRTIPHDPNLDHVLDNTDATASYASDPAYGPVDVRSILIGDLYLDEVEVKNWRRASNLLPDTHPEDPLGILHWSYLHGSVKQYNNRIYVGSADYNGDNSNVEDGGRYRTTSDFVTWADIDPITGDLGEFSSSMRLPTVVAFGATAIVEINGDAFFYILGGDEAGVINTEKIYYSQIDPTTGGVGVDGWGTTSMGTPKGDWFHSGLGYNGRIYMADGNTGLGWMLYAITPHQEGDTSTWPAKGDITWDYPWEELRYDNWANNGVRWDNGFAVGEVNDEAYIYVIAGASSDVNPTNRVDGVTINADGTLGDIVEIDPIPDSRRRVTADGYKNVIVVTGGTVNSSSFVFGVDSVVIGEVQSGGNVTWKMNPEPMLQTRSFHGMTIAPAAQND